MAPSPSRLITSQSLGIHDDNAGGNSHTINSLLNCPLYRSPRPRNDKIAKSTTNRAALEMASHYKEHQLIHGVVLYPKLLERSVEPASALARAVTLQEERLVDVLLIAKLIPQVTLANLSPELNSEQESRDYCSSGIVGPALTAVKVVRDGLPSKFDDIADFYKKFYVSSGFKTGEHRPISDGLLVEIDDQGGRKELMTIEYKTSNALTKLTFSALADLESAPGFTANMVIPFIWPDKESTNIDKATKIIAQVSAASMTAYLSVFTTFAIGL